jgi:hypothetical protein
MAVDTAHFQGIVARVEGAHDAGVLTKRQFMDAWRELEDLLGRGIESDGVEALALYAEPEWLEELGVMES